MLPKKREDGERGQLCDDFYNTEASIAYTILSQKTWISHGVGATGVDKAKFFSTVPPAEKPDIQQCMSLSNANMASVPYTGSGNAYGVVFGMGSSSGFYRFFEKNKAGDLCAQCHDGYKCADVDRIPIGTSMSYSEFTEKKNKVVAVTGTPACGNVQPGNYNEFDTNGLPREDLAGVFVNVPVCKGNIGPKFAFPDDTTLCTFMKGTNPSRTDPWPVYTYDIEPRGKVGSHLYLERYLNCGGEQMLVV